MTRTFLFFLLFSILACSKKDPLVEIPLPGENPPPPVDCSVTQILVNPDAESTDNKDTLLFNRGWIREVRQEEMVSRYTYENGLLVKGESFDRAGGLRKLSTYENNAGAGQLLWERKRDPANPGVVDSFTTFSTMTNSLYLDRILEVEHYTGDYKLKRRYVILWDNKLEQIQKISVRNENNYPVADYTFTCNEWMPNPFRALFPQYINLYVVEPSSFPEAVKIALLFSRKAVTRVTADIPAFQPLQVTYTHTDRNSVRDVVVNGVPAWRFRYACD